MKNFLLLDLGLSLAIPTIVIPALTGKNNALNPNETVFVTAEQASWLGMLFTSFAMTDIQLVYIFPSFFASICREHHVHF